MQDETSGGAYAVEVDGRLVRVANAVMDGAAVLEAAGVHPVAEHVLVRIDQGRAWAVEMSDEIRLDADDLVRFRSFRYQGLWSLKVDEDAWDWAGPVILESEVRAIAGASAETEMSLSGERLRRGSVIDLTGDVVAHIRLGEAGEDYMPVTVNGRRVELPVREHSFEELVAIAYPGIEQQLSRSFTLTYRRGPSERPEGALVPHQSLRLQPHAVLNVTATSKS